MVIGVKKFTLILQSLIDKGTNMDNKLLELTQKVYSEGIEKAKADAVAIIQEANNKAEEIIKEAQQQSAEIQRKAMANANDLSRNAESELKMASRQAIAKLKQQITEMISARAIEKPVKDIMKDKEFIGDLIIKVATCYNNNIELILPQSDKDKISAYFNDRLNAELANGININFDGTMKGGFQIIPKGENYTVSFTDEDFANYFKSFMRPRTIELLFREE